MIALYVPGLTGGDFRGGAVAAVLELLRAIGHADPGGPWLSIGIGVCSGETLMGSIGGSGRQLSVCSAGRSHEFRRKACRRGEGRGDADERADLERGVERGRSLTAHA